ncbi:fimbrial protein [Shigella flexneri]|nr:fimbrial protein [Escherichia coli]MCH0693135.1 fimbrial protein [Escherichia coli]
MRRKLTYLAMAAVMSATPVLATDVSIDFEATITVPTCNMTITGDAISGFGTATGTEFTLEFGDVSLYDIAKKTSQAERNFSIIASDCAGNPTIKTRLGIGTGSKTSSTDQKYLMPIVGYLGMGIKRQGAAENDLIIPTDEYNNPGTLLTWTADDIASGLKMTVLLRETRANRGRIPDGGVFTAQGIFSFTYE